MKDQARIVIIGGGVFGTSVAYHLAKMGCSDVVLVDKGELTSGTTFHSVGLVSQFRTSPALMKMMNYSIRLFNELAQGDGGPSLGWRTVGSLRLASSPDRLKALKREVSRAKAIGLAADIISAKEVVERCPFISGEGLYGSVWVPDDGFIDPNGITYELARQARKRGVEIHTNVRVTGIELSPRREVSRVLTERGAIRTECIVNAAGEWAPRLCEMVGAFLPTVPLMHQYLTTKPIPGHELPPTTPVIRDPDHLFYCREDTGAFLIGAFETNPKEWSPDGVPWEFNQQLLSPEWDLFMPVMENAIRRMPILAEAEAVQLINGPDAFTPDGHYALGPVPGLHGFFVAAGGSINGIVGAGGVGKTMAEWILEGDTEIDVHELDVRRFGPHLAHKPYLVEACREVYRYYYLMRYPGDETEWGRPYRTSPFYERLKDFGAVFGHKNGWERVNYFDPGKPWRQAGAEQKNWGWTRPPSFDLVAEEVRAARERVALFDMTSFGKIDVRGRNALGFLQRLAANDLDRPVGSIVYTQFLNPKGGIESDVTVTRVAENEFRLISGTSFVAGDMGWMRLHQPDDGSVVIEDVTDRLGCLGLWGPEAREVLQAVSTTDVSNAAFPYMTACVVDIQGAAAWAQRVSYAGELGWEIYVQPADALRVFDRLMNAGKKFGIRPAGYKALDSLRLEKGYLYWSADITPEDNPLEAGLNFCVRLKKPEFIGREALLAIRQKGLRSRVCALTMDAGGNLYGGESVYAGGRLIARIRSGGYGHTVGKDIGLVYLPTESEKLGTGLDVEILGKRIPAQVAALPLVDRKGSKIRA
jgi:4-methylaminobutanoate oxidase (formaldehyde-forming)